MALDSYTLPLFSDVGFFFQPILRENLFFASYFFLTLKQNFRSTILYVIQVSALLSTYAFPFLTAAGSIIIRHNAGLYSRVK